MAESLPTTIDIFVPYWGDPGLLHETVRSVLDQASDAWHLTIVDDAYPDASVTARYAALDDPRITVVRHPTNIGIVENFRFCLRSASRELFVITGCDDLLHPDYVDTILRAHELAPEAAIIQPGVVVIDEHGMPSRSLVDLVKQRVLRPRGARTTGGESLARSLLTGNWLYWPSLSFRRESAQNFDFRDDFSIALDLALVLDMVFAGHVLRIDPTVCFSYRRHRGSLSATSLTTGDRLAEDRAYFRLAVDLARRRGWRRAQRAARLRMTSRAHAVALIPQALFDRDLRTVRKLLAHATW